MQRQAYPPVNAASPPLHHPVPQHVSTVPMMRSPPPPPGMAGTANYGSPYGGQQAVPQQQQQPGFMPAGLGGFMNDGTAAMGLQLGQSAAAAGQQYMQQNLSNYISSAVLKHYFNVTTGYVARKLLLVLFPWRHRPWSRQQRPSSGAQDAGYYFLPPREDINSPDMYIPVMALVSYILLSALLAGLRGAFHPEVMGSTLSWAFVVVVCELLALKGGTYLLGINNESQLLDLVAYSGYKFVGVIVTLLVAEIVNLGRGTGGWAGWIAFIYTFNANAFFLLRSLRYVLLPDASSSAMARQQRTFRTYFLFGYSYAVQLVFMWLLTRQETVNTVKA